MEPSSVREAGCWGQHPQLSQHARISVSDMQLSIIGWEQHIGGWRLLTGRTPSNLLTGPKPITCRGPGLYGSGAEGCYQVDPARVYARSFF